MSEKNYRSIGQPKKKYMDKRLDPNYSLAQKRLGQLGVNDDISQEIIINLQKDNRYLQRKLKSVGITLGIVIRELEKNGYTFVLPGRKRSNTKREQDPQAQQQLQAEMNRQGSPEILPESYRSDLIDEQLPF